MREGSNIMNKKDQVVYLSTALEISQKEASVIYDAFCDMMAEGIRASEKIKIGDIVSFKVVDQKERVCRNPKDGTEILVPARKKVKAVVPKGFQL